MTGMNGWQNLETWKLRGWIATYRYGYMMATTIAIWTRFKPNSALSRRELALKSRRDVLANADKIDTKIDVGPVDWLALADYQLCMMPNYRPLDWSSRTSLRSFVISPLHCR